MLEKGEHPKRVDTAMSHLSQIQRAYCDELGEVNLNDVITFYAIDIDDDPSPATKKEDYATKRYYAELQTLKKSLEKNETQISLMTEQMEELTKKLSNSE